MGLLRRHSGSGRGPRTRARVQWVAALVLSLLVLGAAGAGAAPIMVTFDGDTRWANVPNGFASSDSPAVHFSDTNGGDLVIVNDPVVTWGSNALGAFTDTDDSALRIDLDFVASAISMDIGNDAGGFSRSGDQAVLTAYLGILEVGESRVVLNRNGVMDQMITFSGTVFDSVVLKYEVDSSVGLTEVVDNVSVVAVIPEPAAAVVFAAGVLLFRGSLGRQRARSLNHRAARD